MNKTILTVVLAFGMIATTFGQLNRKAQIIKDTKPVLYNTFKVFAEQTWKGDHEMMVYTINNQVLAALEYVELSKKSDYDKELMISIANKWDKKINGVHIIDYEMLVYEYKNQIEAKNSY